MRASRITLENAKNEAYFFGYSRVWVWWIGRSTSVVQEVGNDGGGFLSQIVNFGFVVVNVRHLVGHFLVDFQTKGDEPEIVVVGGCCVGIDLVVLSGLVSVIVVVRRLLMSR